MDTKAHFPGEDFHGVELTGVRSEFEGLVRAFQIALANTDRGPLEVTLKSQYVRSSYESGIRTTEAALSQSADSTLRVRYGWITANEIGSAATTAAAEVQILHLLGINSPHYQQLQDLRRDVGDLAIY